MAFWTRRKHRNYIVRELEKIGETAGKCLLYEALQKAAHDRHKLAQETLPSTLDETALRRQHATEFLELSDVLDEHAKLVRGANKNRMAVTV